MIYDIITLVQYTLFKSTSAYRVGRGCWGRLEKGFISAETQPAALKVQHSLSRVHYTPSM